MKLFTKLFFTHTAIALVSVVSLSILFYVLFREALIQRTIDQLSSINILKKNHIDEYFTEVRSTLSFHLQELDGQQKFSSDELERIKRIYDFYSVAVVNPEFEILNTTQDSSFRKILPCSDFTLLTEFKAMEITSCQTDSVLLVYAFPVKERDEWKTILVLENFNKIQSFLMETTGMGSTGESYLIGPDYKLRSKSRFTTKTVLHPEVDSVAVSQILNSSDGGVILDYRGLKVLSINRTIDIPRIQWTLISEIDFDEAMIPLVKWRNYIVIITIIIAILIVVITYITSRSISNPILRLKTIITDLAKGITKKSQPSLLDTSEVSQITKAIHDLSMGLTRTAEFANEIGDGKFETSYTTLSDQDALGHALIRMRDKLKTLSEQQLRFVREKTAAILEGQENERKRIVQELHDGVGQLLTGIRLRVQMLNENDPVRNEIMGLINETIAEVKRISYNVMPNAIVDFGLEAALKGLCETIRKTSKLEVDFKYVKEFNHVLSFELSIAVFRIAQEGFNNIMKHANATQAELHVLAGEEELYFLIKDNGRGFNVSTTQPSPGIGLNSMKERAQLLDGSLEIYSSTDGTILEGRIPIKTT